MKCAQLIFAWIVLSTALAVGQVPQAPASYAPEEGVLVLRSGQLLAGRIVRQGESYQVALAPGSEVRIPLGDVRIYARSLEEAYRIQRDQLRGGDISARLNLAAWCIRVELPHRAADQLLAVRLMDPAHEGLTTLEGRLAAVEMSRRAAEKSRLAAAERASNPQEAKANPYDVTSLDAAIEQLPSELVESFAQKVQPLLANRCGASGCHGFGSKTDFQVLRPSFQSTFTRRYTQRNLVSALAHLDRDNPNESPLLTRARRIHGGEAAAVLLERREKQNKLLTEWVLGVIGKPAELPQQPPAPASAGPSKPAAVPASVSESAVQQAEFTESVSTPEEVEEQAGAAKAAARDPFDPAIFNRKYHGKP